MQIVRLVDKVTCDRCSLTARYEINYYMRCAGQCEAMRTEHLCRWHRLMSRGAMVRIEYAR